MKWIAHILNNMKLRRKLLAIYLLVGLIPLIILMTYSSYQSYSSIIEEHQTVMETENKRIRNVLFDVTYLVSNASLQLQSDKALKDLITKEYDTQDAVYRAYRGYSTFDFLTKNYSEISKIYLYVNNDTLISSGHFQKITEDLQATDWYQKVESSNGEILWLGNTDIDQYSHICLARKIKLYETNDFAILIISISDYFLDYMNNGSKIHSVLALNNDKVFYTNPSSSVSEFSDLAYAGIYRENEHLVTETTERMLYGTTFRAVYGEDRFNVISINPTAISGAKNTTFQYLSFVLIAMLFPLLFILFFVNHLTGRVNRLKEQMSNITEKNYDILTFDSGKDELGGLFEDMIHTISSLKSLNEEIMNEKLEKQKLQSLQHEMRFELLASQINPHFLFNSLETIRMKAEANEDYEVSYLSEMLGELLRYSLNVKDKPCPLSDEIKYIEQYLKLQKIRFDEGLSFSIAVDDDVQTDTYRILPMLLQPIVENAIIHGFHSSMQRSEIRIHIHRDSHYLYIDISDNGAGMDETTLQALNRELAAADLTEPESGSRRHIGLSNIYNRIKLFYGSRYTLSFQSMKGQGAVFTLILPPPGREEV